MFGEKKSIHHSEWPKWDEDKVIDEEIKLVVQINGKVRSEILVSREVDEESIKRQALEDSKVIQYLKGQPVKKVIYVKNRLVNLVI